MASQHGEDPFHRPLLKGRLRLPPLRRANPVCGTAHNVTSSEMLNVSGSSGGQFDERVMQFQGGGDIVSATVENMQAEPKLNR